MPQLFITAGGRRFNDPKTFPWTVPLYPDFETEGRVVAKYIANIKPDAKIEVLHQNDDYGKDYLKGLRAGLGPKPRRSLPWLPMNSPTRQSTLRSFS